MLAAIVTAVLASSAGASQFQVLYRFSDGPRNSLIVGRDNALYGVSQGLDRGDKDSQDFPYPDTIFRLAPPAAGQTAWSYSVLLTLRSQDFFDLTSLAMDGSGSLYVTTDGGGRYDKGVALRLAPPVHERGTWVATTLYEFGKQIDASHSEGYSPGGQTTMDKAGHLYGTVGLGGPNFEGGLYQLSPPPDGQGTWLYSSLASFDGASSSNGLIGGQDGSFYGSSASGTQSYGGSIWRLTPPTRVGGAWSFQTLDQFSGSTPVGAKPTALIGDRSVTLFGSNRTNILNGGYYGPGTVFRIKPPALGHSQWRQDALYQVDPANYAEGRTPMAVVESPKGVLYGINAYRGAFENCGTTLGCGTIFALTPRDYSGHLLPWNHTTVHVFNGQTGGGNPTDLVKGVSPTGQFALFGVTQSTIFMFVP